METKTYTIVLLMLIIHVMINAQTQNKQAYTHRLALTTTKTVKQTTTQGMNTVANLLKQATHLDSIVEKIKVASLDRSSVEKHMMLDEAVDLSNFSLAEQIKVSELASKIRCENYDLNKMTLAILMNLNRKDLDVLDHAETLVIESETIWMRAKQLREEALMEESLEARLGAMGNAEEKEIMALAKQIKAIDLLNTSNKKITLQAVASVPVK